MSKLSSTTTDARLNLFTIARYNNITELECFINSDDGIIQCVNERDDNGCTSLHICATYGSAEVAVYLLANGATESLNLPDYENGWTPLHRSMYFGHLKLTLILMKAGAKTGNEISLGDWKMDVCPRKERTRNISQIQSWKIGIDHDGFSPLDLLSASLQKHLINARTSMNCCTLLSFGKADIVLGVLLPNSNAEISKPKRVEELIPEYICDVACSKYHSLALTTDGKLFSWGHGRSGRLGHDNELSYSIPTLVQFNSKAHITKVVAAENHTLAISSNGAIYSWGSDRYGQLGLNNSKSMSAKPIRIDFFSKHVVVGIAAGDCHSVCFTSDNELYCWGSNKMGQLGIRNIDATAVPKRVYVGGIQGAARSIIQVSASYCTSLLLLAACSTPTASMHAAISSTNEVYHWGHGNSTPVKVQFANQAIKSCMNHGSGSSNGSNGSSSSKGILFGTSSSVCIVEIAAGRNHNVARTSYGHVYTWGLGSDQLGHGPTENCITSPLLVDALLPEQGGGKVVSICASSNRTCVVTDVGDVYAWGSTIEQGILSPGNGKYQPVPKRVIGIKKAVVTAVGEDHTLVVVAASLPSLPHADLMNAAVASMSRTSSNGGITAMSAGANALSDDSDDDNNEYVASSDDDDDTDGNADADGTCAIDKSTAASTNSSSSQYTLSLQEMCEHAVSKTIDTKNVIASLAFAECHGFKELTCFCTSFIKFNLDLILIQSKQSELDLLLEGLDSCWSSLSYRMRSLTTRSGSFNSRLPSDATTQSSSIKRSNSIGNLPMPVQRTRGSSLGNDDKLPRHDSFSKDITSSASSKAVNTGAGVSYSYDTSDAVAKRIRAIRKKLASIEELSVKLSITPVSLSPATASSHQLDKLSRKQHLISEMDTLQHIFKRLVAEEHVRVKANAASDSCIATGASVTSSDASTRRSADPPVVVQAEMTGKSVRISSTKANPTSTIVSSSSSSSTTTTTTATAATSATANPSIRGKQGTAAAAVPSSLLEWEKIFKIQSKDSSSGTNERRSNTISNSSSNSNSNTRSNSGEVPITKAANSPAVSNALESPTITDIKASGISSSNTSSSVKSDSSSSSSKCSSSSSSSSSISNPSFSLLDFVVLKGSKISDVSAIDPSAASTVLKPLTAPTCPWSSPTPVGKLSTITRGSSSTAINSCIPKIKDGQVVHAFTTLNPPTAVVAGAAVVGTPVKSFREIQEEEENRLSKRAYATPSKWYVEPKLRTDSFDAIIKKEAAARLESELLAAEEEELKQSLLLIEAMERNEKLRMEANNKGKQRHVHRHHRNNKQVKEQGAMVVPTTKKCTTASTGATTTSSDKKKGKKATV